VDVSLALQWAEQVHPRMQVGDARVPLSVCGTRLGRHCCDLCRLRMLDPCKEGVYSDLEVFGPGVSMLFKDLKCFAMVFLLLGCVSLPHFILNMLLGKGVISPAVLLNTRFTDTMLGNLGGQLLNPLAGNASMNSAGNSTGFEVLLGSVGICQAISVSNTSSQQDTAPWLQESVCSLGDSSIALLYTWIDLVVVGVFVCFYFWLRFFQHHEDHLVDRDFATAADFSIYVRGLPAEVDEGSIKSHFEVVVGESVSAVSIARDEPEYVRLAATGGSLLTEWEEAAAASAKTVLVQAALRSAEGGPSEPITIPGTASNPSEHTAGEAASAEGRGSLVTSQSSRASASPSGSAGVARSSPVRSAFAFSAAETHGPGSSRSLKPTQGGSNRALRGPASPGARSTSTATPKGPLRATSPRLERDDIEIAAELITGVRSRDTRQHLGAASSRETATSVHGAVGLHDKETFSEVDACETVRLETITTMAATLSGDPLAPTRKRLLLKMRKLYRHILRARAMHVGVLADAVRYVDADQITQADPSLVKAGRASGWRGMGRPVGAFVTFERQIARRRALKKYANSSWRVSRCLCQQRSMRVKPDVSGRMIMKAVNTLSPAVSNKAIKREAVPRRATQWEAIALAAEKKHAPAKSLTDGADTTPPSTDEEDGEQRPADRAAKMASLAATQSIRRIRMDSGAAEPQRGGISRKRSGADMRTASSGGLLSSGAVQVAAVLGSLSSSSEDDSDFDDDIVGVLDMDFDALGLGPEPVKLGGKQAAKGGKGGTSTANPLAALGAVFRSSSSTSRRRRSVSLNPLSQAITAPAEAAGDRPHSTPHSAASEGKEQSAGQDEAKAAPRKRRTSAALQWSTLAQRRTGTVGARRGTGLNPPLAPPPPGAPIMSRAPSPDQRQRSDGSSISDLGASDEEQEGAAVGSGRSPDAMHHRATVRNRKALRRLSTRWGVDLTATAPPVGALQGGALQGLPSLAEMQSQARGVEPCLRGDFAPESSRSASGSKAFGATRPRRRQNGPAAKQGGGDAPPSPVDSSPELVAMAPPSLPPPPKTYAIPHTGTPSTANKSRYGTRGTTMERHGARPGPGGGGGGGGVLADEDGTTSAANRVFDFNTEHQRLGLYPVEVLEASPPYFVQWANLHISWWGRLLRGSLTTILLVGGLSFSFGLAAYTNAALADAAGTAQTAVCPVASVQLTAELLSQDPRLVPCYCKTLGLINVLNDPLCDEWKVKAAIGLGVTTVSSVTMAVINALLQVVILLLTPFEAHWSKDSEQISLTWRLFVSLFFNTAIIQLLVTADLDFIFNTDLGILSVSSGQLFRDLSPGWYQVVGSLLSAVLMFNIVAPHLLPLGQMFLHNLRRKWAIRRPMWECYWPVALCCACDGVLAPCCCGGSNRPVCPGPCGGMCLCSGPCCLFLSTCGMCGMMEDVGAVSRRQAHMAAGDSSPAARSTATPNAAVVMVSSRDSARGKELEMTPTTPTSMHSNSMFQRPASVSKAYSVMGALAAEASATPEYHLAGMPVRTLDCCPLVGVCTMGCERRWYDYWAPRKQSDLNRVYTGDEFPLVQRYSAILTTVFATFMYSSSMPMLYWLASVSFIAFVWLDFTLLVTFYRSPLHFSARPGVALAGLVPIALVLHFVFAAMAYSNEEIFPLGGDERSLRVGGGSVPVSQVGDIAAAQAGSVAILQRLSRPHVLPLVVAMFLVLLFEVAVRGTVYVLNAWRRQGCSLTKTRESQLPPYSQLLKQNKISGIPSYNFLESAELAERIHVPDHFTEHFGSITDVLLYQSRRIEQIMQWSGVSLTRDRDVQGRRRRRRRKKDPEED